MTQSRIYLLSFCAQHNHESEKIFSLKYGFCSSKLFVRKRNLCECEKLQLVRPQYQFKAHSMTGD